MIQTSKEAMRAAFDASQRPFIERYPFTWFREMREEAPVYYDKSLQAWSIFRYADVQQALSDYRTFSSTITSAPQQENTGLLTSDPPQHRQLRNSINQAFTPRRIASLAPHITEIVHNVLDQVLPKKDLDIVDDIAYPIPATVISEMLGIPEELRSYLHSTLKRPDDTRNDTTDITLTPPSALQEALNSVIEDHRRSPGNDLISALLMAQGEGKPLSNHEIRDLCVLLYIAGHVTTSDLIAHTFLCFSEMPYLIEQVRADFQVIPALVEEVLRYYGTVLAFPRRVTQDVTLQGQQLHAGDAAVIWYASANHDERAFVEPERFDMTRTSNKHLAFGHGIHFCLGAPLARLEAPIVIQAMLERMADITYAPHTQLRLRPRWQFFSLEHLPVTFTTHPC